MTVGLTVIAMAAFAANSLLCRYALAEGVSDPGIFAAIRIVSGAAVLAMINSRSAKPTLRSGTWAGAGALFVYAAAFSYAYTSLAAGVGALLLFGAVQITMVTAGLMRGERLCLLQWLGFALAVTGLGAMLAPNAASPPPSGAALMVAAGIAWGLYSLLGRGAEDPLAVTAGNFALATPAAVLLLMFALLTHGEISAYGALCAVTSGAIASGLGYTIWYSALRGLTPAQGASVQLSVPVLTAFSGALLLGEALSLRLVLVSVTILGGITLAIIGRRQTQP
jgi:drug/metabolite transporter (DMT)-like permease